MTKTRDGLDEYNPRSSRQPGEDCGAHPRGGTVLDLGCSSGYLAEPCCSVEDRDRAGDGRAGGHPRAARLRGGYVGDVEPMDLPLELASFDVVVCGDVIEHLA